MPGARCPPLARPARGPRGTRKSLRRWRRRCWGCCCRRRHYWWRRAAPGCAAAAGARCVAAAAGRQKGRPTAREPRAVRAQCASRRRGAASRRRRAAAAAWGGSAAGGRCTTMAAAPGAAPAGVPAAAAAAVVGWHGCMRGHVGHVRACDGLTALLRVLLPLASHPHLPDPRLPKRTSPSHAASSSGGLGET
jgi:hypothetical protein